MRKVIKTDLQMSREMHILRAQRITTGPQIRGTHPIVVSFENYRDKVCNIYLKIKNDKTVRYMELLKQEYEMLFVNYHSTGRYFTKI